MQEAPRFITKKEINELINREEVIIEPLLSDEQITSVGVDLRLDNIFREFLLSKREVLDVKEDIPEQEIYRTNYLKIEKRGPQKIEIEPLVIHRNEFILSQSLEYICLPDYIIGFLDGRSSLARRGIIIHATAGSIEPGFRGHITFELGNIGKMPVKIYPLMRVANLHLAIVNRTEPYSGQFVGQIKVKPPKPDKDLLRLLRSR